MIAQYRPDIARAVEETVVNLKSLENTLEILRNDLAWLAQSIGHPQAAQLVLTPTRVHAGLFNTTGIPTQFGVGQTPFVGTPHQIGIPPTGPGPGTFGYPNTIPFAGQTGINPFVGQPVGAIGPYAYSPLYR